MNGIVNEIETQEWGKLAAGEIFYNICRSCKHAINEIMSEIEIQEQRKPVGGKFFTTSVTVAHN